MSYGTFNGLDFVHKVVGPWLCSECGQVSQYADVRPERNFIYCRNEACRYQRVIDKTDNVIVENDGTFWRFDSEGNKIRIRAQ